MARDRVAVLLSNLMIHIMVPLCLSIVWTLTICDVSDVGKGVQNPPQEVSVSLNSGGSPFFVTRDKKGKHSRTISPFKQ